MGYRHRVFTRVTSWSRIGGEVNAFVVGRRVVSVGLVGHVVDGLEVDLEADGRVARWNRLVVRLQQVVRQAFGQFGELVALRLVDGRR